MKSRPLGWLASSRACAPGIAVAVTVGAAAAFVSTTYGGPVMLLALLMGMAMSFLSEPGTRTAPGIGFASKKVLRVGVALLGLRIAWSDVAALGLQTVELVAMGVVVTVAAGLVIAALIGADRKLGLLIGGATAICGASAALAISSVLPRTADSERQTIFTVIAVTTLSTLAMIIYPAVFQLLGFDDTRTGILIGATIHDVAQVVGAGYAISDTTGDTATVVKLFRVALLVPMVLAIALSFRMGRGEEGRTGPPIPYFVMAFAALVALNSVVVLPPSVVEPLNALSRGCLVTAVAAIGLSTTLRDITKVGHKPVVLALATTLVLLVVSLASEWLR